MLAREPNCGVFQNKEIIKKLPKGSTRYSLHASFKHEGGKKHQLAIAEGIFVHLQMGKCSD